MQNAHEIHVVRTTSQWHWLSSQLFLPFALPLVTVLQRAFDLAIFVLLTLTGPFNPLLIPFIFLFWYVRRQTWSHFILATLPVGGALQFWVMQSHNAERVFAAQEVRLAGRRVRCSSASWVPMPSGPHSLARYLTGCCPLLCECHLLSAWPKHLRILLSLRKC